MSWWDRAACRGVNPDVFHPNGSIGVEVAQQYCARCPVAADCLEYALTNGIEAGVWGGKSERERRRIRKERRAARRTVPLAPTSDRVNGRRFTDAQAEQIRAAVAAGADVRAIARTEQTSESMIYRVVNERGTYAPRNEGDTP